MQRIVFFFLKRKFTNFLNSAFIIAKAGVGKHTAIKETLSHTYKKKKHLQTGYKIIKLLTLKDTTANSAEGN